MQLQMGKISDVFASQSRIVAEFGGQEFAIYINNCEQLFLGPTFATLGPRSSHFLSFMSQINFKNKHVPNTTRQNCYLFTLKRGSAVIYYSFPIVSHSL